MKKENLKISVIIITFNSSEYILNCLKSVKKSTYPNYEIIVVDNGSKDRTIELIQNNFSEIKLILNNKNFGFAEGNNIGVKQAQGDIIFLLNDDTVIDPNLISILVKELISSDKTGIIGPKIYYMNPKDKVWFGGGKIEWFKGKGKHLNLNTKQEVDYITGCALMIKKKVIDKISLFDKNFFAYYEDADLCQRTIKAGYKIIYIPFGGVWHIKSATSSNVYLDDIKGKYFRMLIRYLRFSIFLKWKNYRNRFIFFMRHARFIYKIVFLIKFIFIFTPKFLWLITGQVFISLIKITKKHL